MKNFSLIKIQHVKNCEKVHIVISSTFAEPNSTYVSKEKHKWFRNFTTHFKTVSRGCVDFRVFDVLWPETSKNDSDQGLQTPANSSGKAFSLFQTEKVSP